MTTTDYAELRINILGADAKKDLDTLTATSKQLNSELRLMELNGQKGTQQWGELKKLIKDIGTETKAATRSIDLSNASLNEMNAYKRQLNTELNKLKVGSAEWIAKLKEIDPVNKKIKETQDTMRGTGEETSRFGMLAKGAFVATAVVAFAKELWDMGMGVLNLTAKFETYETVLKNALGSTELAKSALAMLKDVAAKTPFSLDEMTASFNKMVNRGLRPTGAEITNLADLAASQGKSFDQLTEAVLDAQMGEAERLKEFGIKMKKEGDNVSLSFKGQTTTVKNSEAAIYDAIVAMGDYNGVAGLTGEVAGQLGGKMSNLGDLMDFVTVSLGEKLKPAFHFILDLFARGVKFVGDFIDASAPLGVVFDAIKNSIGGVVKSFMDLFYSIFPDAEKSTFSMTNLVKILATAFMALITPIKVVMGLVSGLIDLYSVMYLSMKSVWAGMTGDFKGAAESAVKAELSWNKLKTNAVKNFGDIGKSFTDIWKDQPKQAKATADLYEKSAKDFKGSAAAKTATNQAELDKQAKAQEKAAAKYLKDQQTLTKKIDKMWADSAESDLERTIIKLQQEYEAELENLDELKVDQKTHNDYLERLNKALIANIEKAQAAAAAKAKKEKEKQLAEEEKRQDAILKMEYETHKLTLESALKNETLTKTRRLELRRELLAVMFTEEIRTIEATAKKATDQEGLTSEQLAAIHANTQAKKLAASKQFNADIAKVDEELKNGQLGTFSDLRIAWQNLWKDNGTTAQQSIDTIAGYMETGSEALKALMEGNGQAFFSSMSAMTKTSNEKLSEALGTASSMVGAFNTVIDTFTSAFMQYYEIKALKAQNAANAEMAHINAVRDTQIAAYKAQYDAGIITKEEYEARVSSINAKADEELRAKQLKLWYEQKERSIRMAKIEALAAYIKTMGTMGLLGLPSAILAQQYSSEKIKMMEAEQPPSNLLPTSQPTGPDGSGGGGGESQNGPKDAPANNTGQGYAKGGLLPAGSLHSQGGIGMWDNRTGAYVGEIEGGEPILSRATYAQNKDLIDTLLQSSIHRNGARVYANGGFIDYLSPAAQGSGSMASMVGTLGDGGITARSMQLFEQMAAAQQANAAATQALMALVASETNGLLGSIKDKPTGLSLHDITTAFETSLTLDRSNNLQ